MYQHSANVPNAPTEALRVN